MIFSPLWLPSQNSNKLHRKQHFRGCYRHRLWRFSTILSIRFFIYSTIQIRKYTPTKCCVNVKRNILHMKMLCSISNFIIFKWYICRANGKSRTKKSFDLTASFYVIVDLNFCFFFIFILFFFFYLCVGPIFTLNHGQLCVSDIHEMSQS